MDQLWRKPTHQSTCTDTLALYGPATLHGQESCSQPVQFNLSSTHACDQPFEWLCRSQIQKWDLFAACLQHLQLVIAALQPGMVPSSQANSQGAPPPGLSVMLDLLRESWPHLPDQLIACV